VIDGIQLTFYSPNPKSHLLGLPCWEVLVNEKTGQKVTEIRTARLRGLDLKLKPSSNGGYNFLVNGSLHKFHNCGEHNADQFTFSKLIQAIDSFTNIFEVDAQKCELHGIEIGVNIKMPYPPIRVFKNIVCYRSRAFTLINKKSVRMGLQCSLTQYRVKVYDKGKQSGLKSENILRFEVAIDKMQVLAKYKVSTLADLQNADTVYSLINVLKETIEGIIWTDSTVNLHRLPNREQKQWLYFSNPKTWEKLSKYQKNRALKKWKFLFSQYGTPTTLLPFVVEAWESLFSFENEAEKPQPFYQHILKSEAVETATFLPLVCTVKRLHTSTEKATSINTTFYSDNSVIAPPKKLCVSCSRDITNQSKRTIFCSEKTYGKTAKKCRNKNSNMRRDKKRLLQKAMKKNEYLVITYIDETGNRYSDTLHCDEITISKEWLDKIKSIAPLTTKANRKRK
jgi:hypothetical protein